MAGILLLGMPPSNSRVTLNAPAGFLNLAKGFGFQADPSNQTSDGYPVTTPVSPIAAAGGAAMPANYFGEFVWKWGGQGSMDILASLPMIISQSSASAGTPLSVGDRIGGDQTMTTVTAPRLQFLFGLNIQALSNSGASNGSGGTLIRVTTKTGYATGVPAATQVNVSGILTQTNANGTWTTATVDADHFDLVGTTWNAGQGSSGVVGVAVFRVASMSIRITASGTFSSFSNLVWCKVADEAAITGGQLTDTVLLNQLKYLLNPSTLTNPNVWLRFMDFSGAQQSWEADFSQRLLPAQLSYNAANFRTGYWAGTVSNGGSDNYTCSDPSVSAWNGSSYIDNAIVQGNVNTTNSGGFPTLAVGGHPAKPIYDYVGAAGGRSLYKYQYFATAPAASAGLTMQFTFGCSGGTWLNGGTSYVKTYTTTTTGPNGNDTTSAQALALNIASAFQADSVLIAAGLQYGNPFITIYPRTAQAGAFTFSQTSGAAIITIQTVAPSSIATGNSSFMYNYLLDGWVYRSGGIVMSSPLEIAVEQANAVRAHVWWCWGTTKGAFVTAAANYFATNLSAGLKFGAEPGNELWNNFAYPYIFWNVLGAALGFPAGGIAGSLGYGALRLIQYNVLSKAAWTGAGRAASDHWGIQPFQTGEGVNGNFDRDQLLGVYFNRTGGTVNSVPTNPIYGAYGGLNGSGAISVDYNVSPNRPVDITNATGCAPYWSSHWLGNGGSVVTASGQFQGIFGTVTQNAPWLQAAKDYANGLASTAYTSMVNQFTGVTSGGSGNNGYNFVDMQTSFTQEEAMYVQYDSGRAALGLGPLVVMDYECGPAWGVGADGNNGINSVNSGDISAIANQMTALGWNVDSWTQSGTGNNKTEMATMAITMFQAWKFDASYGNMIKTNYYQARKNANPTREAHGAQFAYAPAGQWGLFPTDYGGAPYKSYDAIHEFNL